MSEAFLLAALAVTLLCLMWPLRWARHFARLYPPPHPGVDADSHLPPATVILCLRGADPSLDACLASLLAQDYPSYEISIVIDSATDPAWDVVRQFLAAHPTRVPVHVNVLKWRFETCSLKISSQLQAIGQLPTDHGVVAFIDADVIAAPDWLRCMARPLLQPSIGASTGIRWYTPEGPGFGTLVRYLWNAMACMQMVAFKIPWGGSLAFRVDALRSSGLLEHWPHCFCEDTSTPGVLRAAGLDVCFVPAATMVNRETTSMKSCLTFIRRQLVCARLEHGSWPAVLLGGWAPPLGGMGLAVLAAVHFAAGNHAWAALCAGMLACYPVALVGMFLRAERKLRAAARACGSEVAGLPLSWRFLIAAPLTQAVYLYCLTSAALLRRIAWRGVTYRLRGPHRLHLEEYRPYRAPHRAVTQGDSLM